MQGVKSLPVESLSKLTGEIIHRNSSDVDDTIMRVYRMLRRQFEEDGVKKIDVDSFWIFLRSCGVQNLSKLEATGLLNRISCHEGLLDADSFFEFMTKKLSVEEELDLKVKEDDDEESVANELLSKLGGDLVL